MSLAMLLVGVLVLAGLAGTASAYDPEYYDDPAYAAAATSLALARSPYTGAALEAGMNPGGGYANASWAPTIRTWLLKARWLAKTLPAARMIGPVGLGTTTAYLGWKITRTSDTKYIGIHNLFTSEIGLDDHYGLVRDTPHGWEWKFHASSGQMRLNVYSSYGAPCGVTDVIPSSFTGTLLDLWGGDRTQCKQFLLDAYTSLQAVVGTLGSTTTVSCPNSFFGSTYSGSAGTCYRVVASESEWTDYLASKVVAFADWTNQSHTHTSYYDESYSAQGFASQNAQTAAFLDALSGAAIAAAGEFADHAVNPTGAVGNPLLDFEMPTCYDMTVDDCEDAITEAADAVGATVSFNVTTAPAEDTDVARDMILSTFPAASSMVRPESVTLTKNPSAAPQMRCKTDLANPHWSEHDPSVLVSGKVKCNYTGTSSYQMWLWECTETQTSNSDDLFDDVLGGSFGCEIKGESCDGAVPVTAVPLMQPNVGTPIHCPDYAISGYIEWGPGFWIGASVTTNASPVQNDPPKMSPVGLTIPEP